MVAMVLLYNFIYFDLVMFIWDVCQVSAFTHAIVFRVCPSVLYLGQLVASVVHGEEEPMITLGIVEVLAGTCVRTCHNNLHDYEQSYINYIYWTTHL